MLTKVIPSYLFWQYDDDSDLQGFVAAFNQLAQEYVTTFSTIGLPIYTGLSGGLLDWEAAGLYGLYRPIVPSTEGRMVGPINTWVPNSLVINGHYTELGSGYALASDDIFKRYITWQFYKGDGSAFTIEWLKRRIVRFLTGVDGVDPGVDETYGVSVTFGGGREVMITVYPQYDPMVMSAFAYLVKTATLNLPFQFTFNVSI